MTLLPWMKNLVSWVGGKGAENASSCVKDRDELGWTFVPIWRAKSTLFLDFDHSGFSIEN